MKSLVTFLPVPVAKILSIFHHTIAAFYVYAIVAGILGALGDIFINYGLKEAQSTRPWWLLAGFAAWNLSLVFFMLVVRSNNLAYCVIAFLIANSSVVLLYSQISLAERLSGTQWWWVSLGIVALVGMELSKKH